MQHTIWPILCTFNQTKNTHHTITNLAHGTEENILFLVQERLRTEELRTPSLTWPGFELMPSR